MDQIYLVKFIMGSGCSKRKDVQKQAIDVIVTEPATRRLTTNVSRTSTRRKSVKQRQAVLDTRQLPIYRRASTGDRPKTQGEIDKITSALKRHSVLSDLSAEIREDVISNMRLCVFPAGQAVVHEGEVATHFYVVVQGALEVVAGSKRLNILKPGDSFGEQALLLNSVRSATVRTLDSCVLWGLERSIFLRAIEEVNAQRYEEDKAFLTIVPLLSQLTQSQQERLLSIAANLNFGPGRKIVTEGESGDLLFVLKTGSALCTVKGQQIRRLKAGDYFGEQALLQGGVRTATVTAEEPVQALVISREGLQQVLGNSLEKVVYRNTQRQALEACPLLSQLPDSCKERLIDSMQLFCFPEGETVVKNLHDEVFVVLKGELSDGTKRLGMVGVEEMLTRTNRTLELRAVVDTHMAVFTSEALEQAAECSVEQVLTQSQALSFFNQVSLFHGLTLPRSRLLELHSALEFRHFEPNQQIFNEGDKSYSLFLVQKGTVHITKSGVLLRSVGKWGFFGERSVLLNEPRSATATAEGPVDCFELQKELFLKVLDEKATALFAERIRLQDDSVCLDQLVLVKELGRGRISHVFLVAHRHSGSLYALKSISRSTAESSNLCKSLLEERQLLLQLDHIFAAKLVRTLRDSARVYFLCEFVQGLDLYEVMRVMGVLKDEIGRFYAAALVLVLEHLHANNILHRDLKPEKVMVDQSGYPKLVDFGTAKQAEGRSFTILGTPHYMAPEVMQLHGCSKASDMWSLGVLIYEMLCGSVPFGNDLEDPMQVYVSVMKQPLQFPALQPKSPHARSLLESLLQKNPAYRPTVSEVKQHAWLSDFGWEQLQLKNMKPPYVPRLRSLDIEVQYALDKNCDLQTTLDDLDKAGLEEPAPAPQQPGWDECF